jgi:hypothetical protein
MPDSKIPSSADPRNDHFNVAEASAQFMSAAIRLKDAGFDRQAINAMAEQHAAVFEFAQCLAVLRMNDIEPHTINQILAGLFA